MPAALALPLALLPDAGGADAPLPDSATVVQRVNSRDQSSSMVQKIVISLAGPGGDSRERNLSVYRRRNGDETQTVMFFTEPPSIAGTGLLVRDYEAPDRDDGLWLYLPAMRSVRRISSGSRGEKFFATDFTLLEISTDTKLRDDLLTFETKGREPIDGAACLRLEATPITAELVREVKYRRAEYWVDESLWIPRRVVLWSDGGKPIKEVRFEEFSTDGGVWTVHRRTAEDLATGHRTTFVSSSVHYDVDLPDSLFNESGLSRGPPRDGEIGLR